MLQQVGKKKEVETQAQTVLTLGSDQISLTQEDS
jgi:hypothetical protein